MAIPREPRAVERNGLHIRDPKEILHIFHVSYLPQDHEYAFQKILRPLFLELLPKNDN